ncbi:beta-aspartyl asparaginyl family [Micractinium conductrix]|uniref:Beta-aspartyl asparaginyl family n=1 Tax=Micractinium conductrix TaxID=554055 RepID=A0A2P6V7U7_9CHLO|nr:beta-aspartyl asparaginyl family [Micractinium conductrix]|eukprot:PSC70167.1 beta-aspartyl asparaginyl family [Micractinium conductrix]
MAAPGASVAICARTAAPRAPVGGHRQHLAAPASAAPQQRRQSRRRRIPSPPAATLAPGLEALRAAAPPLSEEHLAQAVRSAFGELFWGALAAPRVLASFERVMAGEEHIQEHPGLGLEHSNSYIEGLSTQPFFEVHCGAYKWLEAIEQQAAEIQQEFFEVTADADLARKGNNIWVPAVRGDAGGYGDDWRTLVLQDRGHWDENNALLFPRTAQIVKDLNAPTQEVFFARQPAGTGIKSHTDYVNFIQTSHLGLQVPEGDCWIKVGEEKRNWEEGKVIVCHTSFMHETSNNTDGERVVLIFRHFHPEVTPLERVALQFLFDALDAGTAAGVAAAAAAARQSLAGMGAASLVGGGSRGSKKHKKGKGAAGGGSKGFGGAAPKGFGGKATLPLPRCNAVAVRPVITPDQLQEFRNVTRAYLEWLGEDLSFQQIESELDSLPGSYAGERGGAMLLAYAPTGSGNGGGVASGGAIGGAATPSSGGEEVVGAVALRALAGHTGTFSPGDAVAGAPLADVCEMKRLFVLPGHHGLGAGAALVRALLPAAAELGYGCMVLDTLERLEGANKLYRRLGFSACQRYNDCPLPGVLYFARQLGGEASAPSSSSFDAGDGGAFDS